MSRETKRSVRNPSSPRETTSASSSPSPNKTRSPVCILRPGPDERFPLLRVQLAGEKDFHLTGEMFLARGPRRRLGVNSSPAAKEAGGNHAGVVEND